MNELVVLAVDLGGSSMKGAIVAEDGATIASETRPTPSGGVVDALIDLLHGLAEAASGLGCIVIAAGVVTPGMVDEETGVVLYASNLDWRDVPLLDILSARLDVPVAVGHDVRAAGLAEHLLGAARDSNDFVLVPIGTGVAAALVSAGSTVTGATGAAGEFGHIPVVPDGEVCTCGQRGCLEVYVSGAGLARRYAAHGGANLSSEDIVARLGTDRIADLVWRDAVTILAQGLTIMTLLMDPGVIVLGGGFSRAGDTLLVPLKAAMADALAWRESPLVVLSLLGGEAGRIGAAVLAYRVAGRGDVVEHWSAPAAADSIAAH